MRNIKSIRYFIFFIVIFFALNGPALRSHAKTEDAPGKVITLNKGTQVLKKGKKKRLKAVIRRSKYKKKKITWSSNRKKIAAVSSKGVVKARKKGTAIITARIKGTDYIAKCKIIVGKPVKKIMLPKKSVKIRAGATYTLKAELKPSDASVKKLAYTSSDKTVASVSGTGVIRGLKPGESVIKVTSKDGNKITAKIHVTVIRAENVSAAGSSPKPDADKTGDTGAAEESKPAEGNTETAPGGETGTSGNDETGETGTSGNDETGETVRNVDIFMSLMEKYSDFIRENGDLFYKSASPTVSTYSAAKRNVDAGVATGINCATPTNWALRAMGLNPSGQIYGSSSGFVITNAITKELLEEEAVFLNRSLAVGLTVQRASDHGYIRYGDILSMVIDGSTAHTAVYYGRSEDGHALVYEGGRIPYEHGYSVCGCGPLDYSHCSNYIITEIMRFR